MLKIEKTKSGKTLYTDEFDSPRDFWAHIANTPKDWSGFCSSGEEFEDEKSAWNGTRTYATALKYAREGWPEGLKAIKPMAAALDRAIFARLPDQALVLDTVGEQIDIGTYMSGAPECMMTKTVMETQGKTARIVYNVDISSAIPKSVVLRRGAIMCALIDSLERMGIRTEVYAAWGTVGYKADHYINVSMKKLDEPLLLDRLAFAFCNTAMPRRFMFRTMELLKIDARKHVGYEGSYGSPCPVPKSMQGDVYLPEMYAGYEDWLTDERAIKYALKILADLGVELRDEHK